jgi:hypothetical protein
MISDASKNLSLFKKLFSLGTEWLFVPNLSKRWIKSSAALFGQGLSYENC